ncbi:MAG: hypothetical protein WCQ20_14010 [Synechococcaceae cyanobacterium ELA739]
MNRRPPQPSRSDQVLRLQIFAAFATPLALVGLWLWSKGFFSPG